MELLQKFQVTRLNEAQEELLERQKSSQRDFPQQLFNDSSEYLLERCPQDDYLFMKLVKISHGIIRSVLESSNYELSTGIYDISGNDFISKKMNGGWKYVSCIHLMKASKIWSICCILHFQNCQQNASPPETT